MSTCQGKTGDGRRCSRSARDGALYCWEHESDGEASCLVDADGKPTLAVYELLANATPEEKTDIVLCLIEKHPEGKLELPKRDGIHADLSGVDLSIDTIETRIMLSEFEHPWWGARRESVYLREASLPGANLEDADLRGANLEGANLYGANLKRSYLWRAYLRDANMILADLSSAYLDNADLQGANLKQANLRGAELRAADLRNGNLPGANLQNAYLLGANFEGVRLGGSDLRNADLSGVNLKSAYLEYAKLQRVDLSTAIVTHISIRGAWLDKTRLRREQLGGAIGEELNGRYRAAKHGYLALKQNFDELGDYDAASWAYRKERQMGKAMNAPWRAREFYGESELRDQEETWIRDGHMEITGFENERKLPARHPRVCWFYARHTLKWLSDWVVEISCGYGESIPRVLVSLLIVYVTFALIYGLTWSVLRVHDTVVVLTKEPTRNPIDLAIFSLGAMTTMDPVGLEPRTAWVQLLAGLEALLGIALTGLLGFVLGNRIRRS